MRMVGLEPTWISPLPPQDIVSTSFTTSAVSCYLEGGLFSGRVNRTHIHRRNLETFRRRLSLLLLLLLNGLVAFSLRFLRHD